MNQKHPTNKEEAHQFGKNMEENVDGNRDLGLESREIDGHDSESRAMDGHDSESRATDGHDSESRAMDGHDSESRATGGHDSESRATIWNCFDPEAEVEISQRDRPHWDQPGALTFVTIRLIDSMPKEVIERWLADQAEWLAARGLPDLDIDLFLARTDIPRNLKHAFTKFRNQRWNEDLDRCHGKCLLRDPANAQIVADSLLKFDGDRYDLERFVVMPNHIHLLVQMRASWRVRKQCESWTRFTGRSINARLGMSGSFWAEPFDYVVRNEEQFEYLRQYIVDNPLKARLASNEYLLWVQGVGFIKSHE